MIVENSRRWLVADRDKDAEQHLVQELGIPSLVASILVSRGYVDPRAAHKFLNPSFDDFHNPSLLPDFDAAVKAILGARERKETIFVHGDYDVDGVTSTALFTRFLRNIGCEVVPHVPHRVREGYGIHASAIELATKAKSKLFLTCDCGSGAIESIQAAHEAGLSVVVTDHHSISKVSPQCLAFINPHRTDSEYPFRELSGVGVALKLCEGITKELDFPREAFYRAFLDLAALGTIADVMPLVGENRTIAKFGLQLLGSTKKVGLKALCTVAEVDRTKPITAYHVGFVLGPRLNAAGRIDDAALSLKLLLSTDETESLALAGEIEKHNFDRRAEQERILALAIDKVRSHGLDKNNVILVGDKDWHSGIVGIVAGKLVEEFHRPAFVYSMDQEGGCKASGRSIPRFNLAEAIRAFPELMEGGGHSMAAGVHFSIEQLELIIGSLDEYAGDRLQPEDFFLTEHVDAEIDPSELDREAVAGLAALEPFGCGNPTPQFLARGVSLVEASLTRKPQHVKALFRNAAGIVDVIAFNMGGRLDQVPRGSTLDVLFHPELNTFGRTPKLQWKLRDFAQIGVSENLFEAGDLLESGLVEL